MAENQESGKLLRHRGHITAAHRAALMEKHGGRCQQCGLNLSPAIAQIHHIKPLSEGGTNNQDNLLLLCANCHHLIHSDLSPSKVAAQAWITLYLKRPRATSLSSIAILFAIMITFIAYNGKTVAPEAETDFAQQIKQLEQTERSIHELMRFVEHQKKQVQAEKSNLTELESRRQQLAPLLEADAKIVEAMFLEQERRAEKNAKEQWLFGFVSGIAGSLIASFLFAIMTFFYRRMTSKPN